MNSSAPRLLTWYEENRRDLPWRRTRDPYRIWISEVMLQQTRVETVLGYYQPFLDRFPSVEALAAADPDEVLASWSGLGYYRRARSLHRAARHLVSEGKGFPRSAVAWAELPGVGAYTSAAIASIVLGEPAPVLDGNTIRLLSRLQAVREGVRARRGLLAAAAGLLDPSRPGDSNQALMELGATVCTPRKPSCSICPLEQECGARIAGDPESYPEPRHRRAEEDQDHLVAVVERGDKVLLVRHVEGSGGPLAGVWVLPSVQTTDPLRAEIDLAGKYGGEWTLQDRRGRVRHSITYRRMRLEVWAAEVAEDGEVAERDGESRWFSRAALQETPLSSQVGKALALFT